jgi:hypothetical protein
MEKRIDSNGEPMFNDPKTIYTRFEKMTIGMKRKYVPYWEHLKKNDSYCLWRHISSNKSDTLAIRRYIISSNNKKETLIKKRK